MAQKTISVDHLDCKYSPKLPFSKKSPGELGTENPFFSQRVDVLENDPKKLQQEGRGEDSKGLVWRKDAALHKSKKEGNCCSGHCEAGSEVLQ